MTSELVGLSATMLMPKGVVPLPPLADVWSACPRLRSWAAAPQGWWAAAPRGGGLPSGRRRGQVLAISPACAVSTWASSSALAYCR